MIWEGGEGTGGGKNEWYDDNMLLSFNAKGGFVFYRETRSNGSYKQQQKTGENESEKQRISGNCARRKVSVPVCVSGDRATTRSSRMTAKRRSRGKDESVIAIDHSKRRKTTKTTKKTTTAMYVYWI